MHPEVCLLGDSKSHHDDREGQMLVHDSSHSATGVCKWKGSEMNTRAVDNLKPTGTCHDRQRAWVSPVRGGVLSQRGSLPVRDTDP